MNNETIKQIEDAKALLKKHGYFTDNLWCVDDVKMCYDVDDETAQEILNDTLTHERTMSDIWDMMDVIAQENYELKHKDMPM